MNSRPMSFAVDEGNRPLLRSMGISLCGHVLLVGLLIFPFTWEPDPTFIPSVIDVQMVDLSDLKPAPVKKEALSKEKATAAKEKEAEVAPEAVPETGSAKEAEVSVAPVPKKKKSSKRALKYKTYKKEKVLKNALKRVKKNVDTAPPKPLEDTLKKLREKVAKEGRPTTSDTSGQKGNKVSNTGVYGRGSQKETELIDLYRMEIAYAINKNWAYAGQLSGGGENEIVSIIFKVMPDGTITDITFTDRSGNQTLDDSGYRAIAKSSPVKPHPPKLSVSYLVMGLNFSPQGIR